nr:MAG TPA: hypothetical protein [Caudoviricetes sp.]
MNSGNLNHEGITFPFMTEKNLFGITSSFAFFILSLKSLPGLFTFPKDT